MDRTQLLLLGLPLLLFFSDLLTLFTPPPPPPPKPIPHSHHHLPPPPVTKENLDFPSQTSGVGGIGLGNTVNINFCASCSYRGTAVTMKKMLDTAFPGIDVVLANYPPSLPKRLLAKSGSVFFQIGAVAIVVAGEHIFPMLGVIAPPAWYYSLRANKFGTIATFWLLGNAAQSFLQSSGAFEVYLNDELVFSKLNEGRFPGEIELKDLISKRLTNTGIVDGLGNLWS